MVAVGMVAAETVAAAMAAEEEEVGETSRLTSSRVGRAG